MDDPRRKGARAPTYGDRNEDRRWASPALGVPETVEDEDCTAQYERDEIGADELKERRAKRPPDKRLEKLEDDRDELRRGQQALTKTVGELATTVAGLVGEMKILPDLVSALRDANERANERAAVTLNAQVAQVVAPLEAQRTKLGWVTKLLAIVGTTVAGVLAIIQAKGC